MDMERITQPIEGWFGFIRANFVELFKKLFRVNLYAMAALLLAVLAIVAGAAPLYFTVQGVLGWAVLAVGILVAIILVVIARLFGLASYKVVGEEHSTKQKVDIIGVATQKAIPAIIYGLIMLAIYVLVLILFGAVGLGLAALTGAAGIIGPLVQLGIMLVSIVLGFFLQFALWELVLADKGPVGCMRASFGLVKRNFWETVVFSIVRAIVGWAVSIPFTILLVVAIFGAAMIAGIGGVALAIFGASGILMLALGAILVVLFIPYAVAYNAADETAGLSMEYRYWKTIRGDMRLEKKPAAASGTGAPAKSAWASESRAMTTTVESPMMVAPAAGAMAAVQESPMAVRQKPEAPAKKAPPKKRAADKKSS